MDTLRPDQLLKWSKPERKMTYLGDKMVREAAATAAFWEAWREDKAKLRAAGISVKKVGEKWVVQWFQPLTKKEVDKDVKAIEISRATDADVVIPAPDGLSYLPYQRAGINYGATRKATLIGDEMGLGKTIQAIGIVNATPKTKRILVICPASLKLNWAREMDKWFVEKRTIGLVSAGQPWPKTDVVIINYDMLSKWRAQLRAKTWDILIADECHYIKNPKAQRTKEIVGHKSRKKDEEAIEPIPTKRRVLMTGTPIINRPIELWPIVHYLAPEEFNNFFQFAKRYCDAKQNGYGWDFRGASNLPELQNRLRASFMVRRLKKDVLTELPAKRRQIIALEPDTAGLAAIKAEEEAEARHADERRNLLVAYELAKASEDQTVFEEAAKALTAQMQVAFTEIAKLRLRTALAKVDSVIEHIENAEAKVVVMAHHREVIDRISKAFPGHVVVITGETSLEDRQKAVDRFQTDPDCLVFVGSIRAAGVGLTLTASSHVVFAELDWTPGAMSQAEDRCHRIGQVSSVLVQHIVLDGSIDGRLAKTLIEKQRVADAALDKDAPTPTVQDQPTIDVDVVIEAASKAAADRATRSVTRAKIAQEAETLTKDQIAAIHQGLRILAGFDADHARIKNEIGFNMIDGEIGHSLANQSYLTPRQAALGKRLVNKYRRQLPEDLVARAKGEDTSTE